MFSRYGIFCKVVELRSFTRAAAFLGYSQSSVSQTVKALERELGVTLVERRKDGIVLTVDGEQFYPYFQAICAAERNLEQKRDEMAGLGNSTVTIGTFTSVSRTILPPLMKEFKKQYPTVTFVLRQGEYTSIGEWIANGSVDFGFIHAGAVPDLEKRVLYEDEMLAVLPQGHPLACDEQVSLQALAREPFILLDEGEYSVSLTAFERLGVSPGIAYEVYDDYTILAMVRQNLGVSLMYGRVLEGFGHGLAIRPVTEAPKRVVALAWKDKRVMPFAARRFVDFVVQNQDGEFI